MIENYEYKCFISCTSDQRREFVRTELYPILKELNIFVFSSAEGLGSVWSNEVFRMINKSDFIIVVIDKSSKYQYIEIGAALGQNKPVLPIVLDNERIPSNLIQFQYLRYNPLTFTLGYNIKSFINSIDSNIIPPIIYKIAENHKVLGIKIENQANISEALRVTADFVDLFKRISGSSQFNLIQTSKGSLKSFFEIDFKPWTELAEKIIFFIPEWQKRKNENLLIESNIESNRVKSNKIETERKVFEANAMLDLLLKSKKLGIKFQIDNDIIVSINSNGIIEIKEPKKPDLE